MLSDNIKNLRKNKGYSQETLAQQLNVVRQTVSKWEQGLSVPDAALLSRIAEVLDVPVSTLLGSPAITEQNEKDIEEVARQLAILNDQLALRSRNRKNLLTGIVIGLFILGLLALLPNWSAMWHEFGENLYHMLH